jgi:hypothetical protein
VTLGLARLRAHKHADTIRAAVLADQQAAVADAGAAIAANSAAATTPALAASRDSLIKPEPSPVNPRVTARGLSEGATQLLRALFKAAGGGWIDQRKIPHGLPGRTFPGYLAGLAKRGLVEARWDGGAQFSARMTVAGALMAEP